MKFWKVTAALSAAAAALLAAPAAQATEVGVSVEISQPGVYGRIDIGRYPRPEVVRPRPVIVHPAPPHGRPRPAPPPVYLWVPPGHRRHWARHCARYQACDRPVYFVRDDWYDRDGPGRDRGPRADDRRHDDRKAWRDDRREDRRDDRREGRPDGGRGDRNDRDDRPGRGHGRPGD
ncbi:MAG: hypothetical protein L6Q75_00970 [Burkholderiaceae bacterium]|nr:hypothetical protein [Burkholderiaceae bacterium]